MPGALVQPVHAAGAVMTRLLRVLRTVLWGTVAVILLVVAAAAWWPESTTATVHDTPTTSTAAAHGRVGSAAVGLSGPAGAGMVDVRASGRLPAGAQVRKALGGLSLPDPFDGLEGTVTVITIASAVITLTLLTVLIFTARSPR